MYDTVVLTTEGLTPEHWRHIEDQLQARYGVNAGTGEVDYLHYVSTILIPESACPVRLTVRTAKWIKMPGAKEPRKVDGIKSIRVEASLHRAMLGHNCFGGPDRFLPACRWLICRIAELLETTLPCADGWLVRRIDVAECFDLGSEDAVRAWIRSKSLIVYPRRQVHFWGDVGFGAPGTTTDLRAYAKGIQLRTVGGYKALCQIRKYDEAVEVMALATRCIRCELEIKADVWDRTPATVNTIDDEAMHLMYDRDWAKFIRPLDSDGCIARTPIEVEHRLQAAYPTGWLGLYGVWCQLAVRGEGWYRQHIGGSTWRTQRAKFERARISWTDSNILSLSGPLDLADFCPTRDSSYRLSETHHSVEAKLAAHTI